MMEFLRFLRAVWQHWVWFITGATISVVLLVWPRVAGGDISTRVFWGIVVVCLLSAFFLAWRDEHRERLRNEEKLRPKLEIVFQNQPPFVQETKYLRPRKTTLGQGRWYRVKVKNIGGTSIPRIVVTLEDLDPTSNVHVPLRLHVMHDNPHQGEKFKEEFPLDPDQAEFIDLIEELTEDALIRICTIVRGLQQEAPAGKYKITIKATGENVAPCQQAFEYELGTDANAKFSAV